MGPSRRWLLVTIFLFAACILHSSLVAALPIEDSVEAQTPAVQEEVFTSYSPQMEYVTPLLETAASNQDAGIDDNSPVGASESAIDSPASAAKEVSVIDYGALPDGSALSTSAFNRAIRDLEVRGGGVLRVPPGSYVVTTIYLGTNITLVVEKGATILASTEAEDWEPVPYKYV